MQRDVILIFGQTGCGKTYLARQIARSRNRVLVADAGFQDFAPIPSAPDYDTLLSSLNQSKAFNGGAFRIAYDFRREEYPLIFATALELRGSTLVIDEADRLDISDYYYQEALYRGRHYGLSLVFVALQPTSIPTDVRRQATCIVAFRQLLPADVDWLSQIVGETAFQLPSISGPPNPPPHSCLFWTQAQGAQIVPPGGLDRLLPANPACSII